MRIDPISNRERAYIIAQLARTGKWSGTHRGALVHIVRFKSPSGSRVLYAVRKKSAWVNGQESTVARAVEACNEIIGDRPSVPDTIPFFKSSTLQDQWLPYKDA